MTPNPDEPMELFDAIDELWVCIDDYALADFADEISKARHALDRAIDNLINRADGPYRNVVSRWLSMAPKS